MEKLVYTSNQFETKIKVTPQMFRVCGRNFEKDLEDE